MASVFDERQLFVLSLAEGCSLRAGSVNSGRNPPSQCTPKTLQLLAAVRVPAARRVAVGVVDVRLDRATVAGLDVGHVRADSDDLDAELMPGDARIAKERHLAEIPGNVRPADTNIVHAYERVVRTRLARFSNVD